ncbi:hypothetical protein [Methylorubrum extorquens]|uniref:hypothetical protein n=1 Tax=Methylorubrum extorquens TaxID=408 RepID=UPI00209FD047|nr:hypothetical protein [Methylorubrum extorquens]MCP1538093.1 hypothetical protein [Methylorubrum extorquens]
MPTREEIHMAMMPESDSGHEVLFEPSTDAVWVIFHGMRHRVASAGVYDALFRPHPDMRVVQGVEEIVCGPDLVEGTCLVKGSSTSIIYLVTGAPAVNVRKYEIMSFEYFQALQFDESLCRVVPDIVLSAIPNGPKIG